MVLSGELDRNEVAFQTAVTVSETPLRSPVCLVKELPNKIELIWESKRSS